jgi:hypothetical protein
LRRFLAAVLSCTALAGLIGLAGCGSGDDGTAGAAAESRPTLVVFGAASLEPAF